MHEDYFAANVPEVNFAFDDLRNQILRIVNPIYAKIGKLEFPEISSDYSYDRVTIRYSNLSPQVRKYYKQVLKRSPPLLPLTTKRFETTASGDPLVLSEYNQKILDDLRNLHSDGIIDDDTIKLAFKKLRKQIPRNLDSPSSQE